MTNHLHMWYVRLLEERVEFMRKDEKEKEEKEKEK